MPTKNQAWTSRPARRSTAKSGAGRFSRPLSVQSPPPRRGRKQQSASTFGALMSALPIGGPTAKKNKASAGGGRAKPAMALVALAGGVLGRKQLQKRKAGSVPPPGTAA